MQTSTFIKINPTNDRVIRNTLKKELEGLHSTDHKVRIIEELGVQHGTARVDIAVVNGILHGYEIKSDLDTLDRLPEQVKIYNSVFNEVTLVVGRRHLFEAMNMVPDWWGITLAKMGDDHSVLFNCIRKSGKNVNQDITAIAALLWREEALALLEKEGKAKGIRSKPRRYLYEKLSNVFEHKTLEDKVREVIFFREDWRLDAPLMLNGGLYRH
jgi:hypothetical protein